MGNKKSPFFWCFADLGVLLFCDLAVTWLAVLWGWVLHCTVSDRRERLVWKPLMSGTAALPQGGYYFCVSDHKAWLYMFVFLFFFISLTRNIHTKKKFEKTNQLFLCVQILLLFIFYCPSWLSTCCIKFLFFLLFISLSVLHSAPLPPISLFLALSFEFPLLSLSLPYITPSHPSVSTSDIPL